MTKKRKKENIIWKQKWIRKKEEKKINLERNEGRKYFPIDNNCYYDYVCMEAFDGNTNSHHLSRHQDFWLPKMGVTFPCSQWKSPSNGPTVDENVWGDPMKDRGVLLNHPS